MLVKLSGLKTPHKEKRESIKFIKFSSGKMVRFFLSFIVCGKRRSKVAVISRQFNILDAYSVKNRLEFLALAVHVCYICFSEQTTRYSQYMRKPSQANSTHLITWLSKNRLSMSFFKGWICGFKSSRVAEIPVWENIP